MNANKMLADCYRDFNNRNIDGVLAVMHPEVDWPNGMEGGRIHGTEAIRDYWTRQFEQVDPHAEPVDFVTEPDGRINITVRQVVHDTMGNVLSDQLIHHIYTITNGLITSMEIYNPAD